MDIRIEVALRVLESYLGKPYTWGGDDPMVGFDCSGLVIEALKAAGILPRGGWDNTSDGLFHMEQIPMAEHPYPGVLAFWGNTPSKATHVEMVWRVGPEYRRGDYTTVFTVGASGGGSSTKTLEDAIRDNAFIKIRPLRPGWIGLKDPFKRYRYY